jgi:hypothetical protein
MKVNSQYDKLIRIARNTPPDERVPYAFEKRIMARLAEARRTDPLAWWASRLWKAAGPCLIVTVLVYSWAFMAPDSSAVGEVDLSGDLEKVVYASMESHLSSSELNW